MTHAMPPTYRELREEGVPEPVIQTLTLAHDGIRVMTADDLAEWLHITHRHHPVSDAQVWPRGDKPAHWGRCEDCRGFLAFDDHDLCGREGDAPEQQWQVTTPEAVWS